MEPFVLIALIAFVLVLVEFVLPTGGALAAIGAAGLIASGIVALGSDSDAANVAGPALIVFGILTAIAFVVVARKVLRSQVDNPAQTGAEQMVGGRAEARSTIAPDGRVWMEGTLWAARLAPGAERVGLGDKVLVEAFDGLTLIVRPEPKPEEQSSQGGSS
jgi:membrane-bound serine protease (ClpP class)